jgi:hypothetical protein
VKHCKEHKRFIQQTPIARVPVLQMPVPKQEKPKQKSHFEAFQKLIEVEEDKQRERESEELARRLKENVHKTNFPEISAKNVVAKKSSDSILTGWSKVVGKPVKVYETLSEEEEVTEDEEVTEEEQLPSKKQEEQKVSTETNTFNPYSGGSWADYE